MKEFEGKVVLVTGAGRGIGLQTVKEFAREGAQVILVARDEAKIAQALDTVREGRERVKGYRCDLSQPQEVDALFARLRGEYPQVDILVNNVGAFSEKRPWDGVDQELWRRTLDLNTLCPYRCAVAVADWLIEAGKPGCIVNIGSSSALRLKSGRIHYTASKAAVHTVSQVLALDLAPHGIRVNVVSPGPTATETLRARFDDPALREAETYRVKKIPMGRYAEPAEVAQAILFLASERASFITGAILPVDGGYTIGEPF